MKLMFISDIHGSDHYFTQVLGCIEKENPDQICLLGDLLYHGPRNPLPKGYDPKSVIGKLNNLKDKIVAIRGNCDSEVDQMVLDFPMMADYIILYVGGRRLMLTHGHLFKDEDFTMLSEGDCVVSGHTHIPRGEMVNGIHFLNPGSTSLPKAESAHSYGIFEDGIFTVKSLVGETVLAYDVNAVN